MKKLLVSIAIVSVIAGGLLWYSYEPQTPQEENVGAIITGNQVNVIGTHVGTTTTGVAFPNFTVKATATYPFVVNSEVDTATFFVQSTTASSSANMTFQFFASNDYDCDTASTTAGTLNNVITTDIDWYDIGSHELNSSLTGLNNATTTYPMTISETNSYRQITFTNLNARCLAVRANGTSTVMYMGVVTKSHKAGY